MFAVGRLLETALSKLGIRPDTVAGNSIGEWNAMLSAGVLCDATADAFWSGSGTSPSRCRTWRSPRSAAMSDRLTEALGEYPDIVLSHENSPNQSIVCGPPGEVDELVRMFRDRNVFGQVLPFRSGFHTPMLAPFLGPLREKIAGTRMRPVRLPLWSATTASPYPVAEEQIRELFIRHLVEPVRFRSTIDAMYADGARVFVQVGVGQLTSLIDDTLRGRPHLAVASNGPHRSGLDQLRRVATAIWVEGGTPDFTAVQPSVPLPARGIRLDLGAPLVRLGADTPKLELGSVPRFDSLSPLVASELTALFQETSALARDVLAAACKPQAQHGVWRSVWRVSTETMPYLFDHTLVRQRDGWPDDTDRQPVVPATTTLRHIMDAAEAAAPGQRAVAVVDVRLDNWLVAAPRADVEVSVTPVSAHQVTVNMGNYASATVSLAPGYSRQAPAQWAPQADRPPKISAAQLYDRRWLFHGPLFQGVREVLGIHDHGIRAVLRATSAPGSLLDAVGQLLAHWTVEKETDRRVVFPVHIEQIRFFDADPEPGADVECVLRVRAVSDDELAFDAQVVWQGTLWAEITGWRNHRFHCAAEHEQAYYFPEINTLSRPQDGGWWLVKDQWPSISSRNLYLRKYLSAAERLDYGQCSPRRQRQWLLGRIAVKDAVRGWLWEQGWGPLFPAEILVRDDESGRPVVSGLHGLELPDLEVSLAHCDGFGVAMAQPPGGIGIDIAKVAERPWSTIESALTDVERELLPSSDSLWFHRFSSAKKAAAKAAGTGAQRCAVVAVDDEVLTVLSPSSPHVVRTKVLPGDYVVAWTEKESYDQH